ncbi:TasA family protein [Nocardioides nanhaiensis]|uniref:Camelysin metallo-endopeptidase n=1 Tax=Nocardioides nanhaiensis TaxID=1476871 RepID=A0ABP8WGQ9_9ACTN
MGKHTVSRTAGRKATTTKVLASVALVGAAASVAGLGTFGSFTSTTSASQAVSTGKVVIGLTQHATAGTTVAATNLVPGDTVQRAVTLTRSSDTEAFGSVRLTTAPTGAASLLTSDATNGLQLKVDQCSVAWVKAASNELTCSGTTTPVVTTRAVVGSNLDLTAATSTLNTAAAASNLRVSMLLPEAANNDFQGLSSTIGFTFDATQRAASFR